MHSIPRNGLACWIWLLALALVMRSATSGRSQENVESTAADTAEELPARWEYFAQVPIPPPQEGAAGGTPGSSSPVLLDLILDPEVFSHSRLDLGDLRLYDSAGQVVPYSLRYLRPQLARDRVPASEFNRVEPEEGPNELTLDLQSESIQYNEITIKTSGTDFRRPVQVDGSDDAKSWRRLVTASVMRFLAPPKEFEVASFTFADSRFRYLRVRVYPDPFPEEDRETSFRISDVSVWRYVDVPGERLTRDGSVKQREPARAFGAPASAWIIELGGDRIPCDQIEVDVADAEFARDISVAAELSVGPLGRDEFVPLGLKDESLWQRKPGDPRKPMIARFDEVQTRRLKLEVTDHRNPPLSIRSVRFSAPARQIVFARPATNAGDLRLNFGNPRAEPPNYDFARNLPAKLVPPPTRTEAGHASRNPDFVPPPQPLTERWPWLIYVVLGSISLVLAVLMIGLSRAAIAAHDSAGSSGPVPTVS